MRALLRAAGGNLFEDSLEIETEATIWTPTFLEDFEKSRGYDLRPWLPFVLELKEKYQFSLAATDPATADSLRTNEIRDDYNQVLSDLYLDCHLPPAAGLRPRSRPGHPDPALRPRDRHDASTPRSSTCRRRSRSGSRTSTTTGSWPSGRDMAGHTLLSCEAICYNGAAYNTTWGANTASPTAQNQALFTINSIFAAGVNRLMIHGFPYAQAPEVTWPGFAAFSPYYNNAIGFGEAWGPRTPQWEHVPGIADYIARTQLVLQTGTPRYDIAFWRHKGWASTGIGPQWITNNGTKLGWSHSFMSASLLELAVGDGPRRSTGPRRAGVQGTGRRPRLPAQQRRHHGHRRRRSGCSHSAGPACRSSSSATGRRSRRSGVTTRPRPRRSAA